MIQTPSHKILAIGSIAFDDIQTPEGRADRVLGGSCNYFSVAASYFVPISIVGVVGEDFPKSHLQWLNARNIDTSAVEITPGKTFHWTGQYNDRMNEAKTLATHLNVFEHFNPKLKSHQVHSPYLFLANIDPVLQSSVLDQAQGHKLVACDTMNFWITGKLKDLKETLKKVDILSINEGEAFLLSGKKNLISAANTIHEMGPSVVVIKKGEYGSMLFTPSGIFMSPAFPLTKVVDPTGAGDTFAGGFMGYLAQHGADRKMADENPKAWDRLLRNAVLMGSVLASFTVEDFSLHRLMQLEKAEIDGRHKALLKMTTID